MKAGDGGVGAEAIMGYVGEVMGWSPADVACITRFGTGERHAVYRVSYAGSRGRARDVVVRVLYSAAAEYRAMAQREAKVLEVVDGIAAPRLYDFRAEGRWFATPATCLAYVAGRHEAVLGGQETGRAKRLGVLMGRLHALRVDDLVAWFPVPPDLAVYAHEYVEWILGRIAAVGDALPGAIQRRIRGAADVFAHHGEQVQRSDAFATGEPPALLHGDVGPDNMLWAQVPVLIDWEYARLGDPADDVASIFVQNELNRAQRHAFWDGYAVLSSERAANFLAERARWWAPAGVLGSAAWWAERYALRANADAKRQADPSVPRRTAYYLEQVVHRLDRFSELTDG